MFDIWWARIHADGEHMEVRKSDDGSRPAGDGWSPLNARAEVEAQLEVISKTGMPVKTTRREGRPKLTR